ncbi:MAG: hypothetical protein IPG42_06650 [Betaproteobacteria bacterium]|nr:hypothetical protein [Betaproteobacteria bacterium]
MNEALLATPLALLALKWIRVSFLTPRLVAAVFFVPGLDVIWSIMDNPGWTYGKTLLPVKQHCDGA